MRLDSYFSNTLDELFLGEIATAKFVASIINISKWQIYVLCELLNYILTGIVQYGNDGFRTESMQYTNFAPFLLLFRAMGSFDE